MASQVFNQTKNNPDVVRATALFETARRTGDFKEYWALKKALKAQGIPMPEFRHIRSGRGFAPPKQKR